jgi:acyl carrier protein
MPDTIERRVRTIVAEVLHIHAAAVLLTSRLRSDLNASRGQRVEILCRLEEEFAISLGLSRAQSWRHVSDLVISVERKLEDQPRAA